MTFRERVQEIVDRISYKENYRLLVEKDKRNPSGRIYLQVECARPDSITGDIGIGRGGKVYLSPAMTTGEIIRKAFQMFVAYEEHECREFFKVDGKAVFGPHISVEALLSVAHLVESRPPNNDTPSEESS